jgi:Family of unknown function (DUF6116)
MAAARQQRSGLIGWASGLRFPQLLGLVALLFVLDLIVPDPIPFLDEALLGLLTLLFASWKRGRGREDEEEPRVVKNVTPKNGS